MKNLLPIFLLMLFISCSVSQYERNMEIMTEKVKTSFENFAFDENAKIEFHEFVPIKYDTVNDNILFSKKIENNKIKIGYYKTILKKHGETFDDKEREFKKYIKLNMKNIAEVMYNDMEFELKKINEYNDSIKIIIAQSDSLIAEMEKNLSPKPIYRFFVYLKATLANKTEIENIRDTAIFLFNDKFEHLIQ